MSTSPDNRLWDPFSDKMEVAQHHLVLHLLNNDDNYRRVSVGYLTGIEEVGREAVASRAYHWELGVCFVAAHPHIEAQ